MKTIKLPLKRVLGGKVSNNPVMQFDDIDVSVNAEVKNYEKRGIQGHLLQMDHGKEILVVPKNTSSKQYENILLGETNGVDFDSLRNGSWIKPVTTKITSKSVDELENLTVEIRNSWQEEFYFSEEDQSNAEATQGLRPPQIGGLYASLAHWKVTEEIGTVVMPTGTGKTETMLALLINQRPERLLVVAPTSALRTQITDKFCSLGLLKEIGVVGKAARLPLVGKLEKSFKSAQDARNFLRSCNVVVATMQIISACPEEIQEEIASWCSHLFIDEAHHAPAKTWDVFRSRFTSREKPVLQFTATPYRNDGRHVGGKIIFNYPLQKAQEENYFKSINFKSLWEYDKEKADRAIASAAIEVLEEDITSKYDHLMMARVGSIEKAKQLHGLYIELAPQFSPLLIHSQMNQTEKRDALEALRSREARIIVCVNMLGEGFDLPELKIAALHEIHKSLAVTIQFVGRFTRTASHIGNATVIANSAEAKVEAALEKLYAADSDWNIVLRRLSEGETVHQERRSDFIEGFANPPTNISLYSIRPKMSTVAYRTRPDMWNPDGVSDVFKDDELYTRPSYNSEHRVLVFVTVSQSHVIWGQSKKINDITYDLYLLHWNEEQKMLYINSTNNDSLHTTLAKAVCGDDAELIRGEEAFRPLHGVNRAILTNLGVKNSYSRAAQFTMYVGSNLKEGVQSSSLVDRVKTNLFARGFREGEKVSIGCSLKGRIWSFQVADDMSLWMDWVIKTGEKLLDDSISTEEILKYVIIPERIQDRPSEIPIAIEWSEHFLARSEDTIYLEVNGQSTPFYEVDLNLVNFEAYGPIRFAVCTEKESIEYEIVIGEDVTYKAIDKDIVVKVASKSDTLSQWFQSEPPIIRFANNGFLIYNLWCVPNQSNHIPFDLDKIQTWDWTGTSLKKESKMKAVKGSDQLVMRNDSIQSKVIEHLKAVDEADIIFDDDGSGEAADVVTLKVAGDQLIVNFYHCKFSQSEEEGARVGDLYEVCGQTQKSVYWKGELQKLFNHLKLREIKRLTKYEHSRFEKGDLEKLNEISRRSRHLEGILNIFIVQPGVSKAGISDNQLGLLGATELFLNETYSVPLAVITSV